MIIRIYIYIFEIIFFDYKSLIYSKYIFYHDIIIYSCLLCYFQKFSFILLNYILKILIILIKLYPKFLDSLTIIFIYSF